MRTLHTALPLVVLSHFVIDAQQKSRDRSIAEMVRSSLEAVVLIEMFDSSGNRIRQGSGFLLSPDGQIATNYHVIEGASSGQVKLNNGASFPIAGVVAARKNDDIAVLKVLGNNLPYLPLADASNVSVGDRVMAIGSPLGLQNSVSDGVVSAFRVSERGTSLIQTSAPISPGNSGGPLLNLDGAVAGILTFKWRGGENLNFAVASSALHSLLAGPHTTSPATPLTLLDTIESESPSTVSAPAPSRPCPVPFVLATMGWDDPRQVKWEWFTTDAVYW